LFVVGKRRLDVGRAASGVGGREAKVGSNGRGKIVKVVKLVDGGSVVSRFRVWVER